MKPKKYIGEDWLTENDKQFLFTFSKGVALEIGCWKGNSTRHIGEHAKTIYCFDTFMGTEEYRKLYGAVDWYLIYKQFEKNTEHIADKIYLINPEHELHLYLFLQTFQSSRLDFIFIDGEHGFKGISNDIKYRQYLKEGGIIAIHDTTASISEKKLRGYLWVSIFTDIFIFFNPHYRVFYCKDTMTGAYRVKPNPLNLINNLFHRIGKLPRDIAMLYFNIRYNTLFNKKGGI